MTCIILFYIVIVGHEYIFKRLITTKCPNFSFIVSNFIHLVDGDDESWFALILWLNLIVLALAIPISKLKADLATEILWEIYWWLDRNIHLELCKISGLIISLYTWNVTPITLKFSYDIIFLTNKELTTWSKVVRKFFFNCYFVFVNSNLSPNIKFFDIKRLYGCYSLFSFECLFSIAAI